MLDCFMIMTLEQKFGDELTKRVYLDPDVLKYEELRYVMVTHVGFDGCLHLGELIVHKWVANEVLQIFKELYVLGFPIEKMKLISEYNYSDDLSMRDNNSSAFNYRRITNGTELSLHAFGIAIDINPVINPYIEKDEILPVNGACFINRNQNALGMIKQNCPVYKLFKRYGWKWGGDWDHIKDYHHFEKPFK